MPGYQTHLTAAGTTAVALITLNSWNQPVEQLMTLPNVWSFCACLLGGLFPDVDIKSKGQKLFYALLGLVLTSALWYRDTTLLTACGVLAVIPPLLPHRGITHELWFIILAPLAFPFAIALYSPQQTALTVTLYLYFVVGALTHLVLDFGPVRFLKRINRKRR